MKKIFNHILIKILVFSFLLGLEVIAYNFNFFLLLNCFIAAIGWFHIIYYMLGFTYQEHILRMEEPIQFKFSFFYLFKLIKRGLKIKYILIKNFIFNKNHTIIKIISVIFLILISLIIVRFFRWSLLIEIFKIFNITENLSEFLAILSFSIIECYTWVMRLLNQGTPFEYLYIIEKPKKYVVTEKSPVSNYLGITISYMKKAATQIEGVLKPKISRIQTLLNNFNISNQIKGKNATYSLNDAANYIHNSDDTIEKFKPASTHIIEECFSLPTINEQITYMHKNAHSFLHQVNLYLTYTNYQEIKQTSMIDWTSNDKITIKYWESLSNKDPKGIKKKIEIIKNFENHFTKNIMPIYGEDYFRAGIKNYKFTNVIYEVLFQNSLKRLNSNFDYFGIPAEDNDKLSYSKKDNLIYGQPDAVYYLNDKNIIFQQKKYTSNVFGNGDNILNQFDTKYQDTDNCILAFRNNFLLHQNIYDEATNFKSRRRLMTLKTLLPFNPEINTSEIKVDVEKTTISKIKEYMKYITDAAKKRQHNEVKWKPVSKEIGVRKLPSYSPSGENFHFVAEYSEEAIKNKENLIKELNLKFNKNSNEYK